MFRVIVTTFAFIGAWMILSTMDGLEAIAFNVFDFGVSWALLFSVGVGLAAMNLGKN